jgi:methylglyoxal synthase
MKNENKSMPTKRIAVVAPIDKRKEVIEWSYFNKARLESHTLIATSSTASILEGTINKPVHALAVDQAGGYDQLSALIAEKKIDIIFFFDNPMKSNGPVDDMRKLLDMALEMNVVIASHRSTMDFMPACA